MSRAAEYASASKNFGHGCSWEQESDGVLEMNRGQKDLDIGVVAAGCVVVLLNFLEYDLP